MKEIFEKLLSEWWGIAAIITSFLALVFVLSVVFYRQFFKRFYDIVLSGMALLILSPVLLLLTVIGAVKMKGNPFFTQLRPGKDEKIFKLIKFRTMTCEKDENGKLLPDEKRLTSYGKVLRSTSLDELPELINIFIGHMSIVGPRPLLPEYLEYYTELERHRHDIRPGLTGLSQVNGRNALEWDKRLSLDVEYVNNYNLLIDVKIIFMTAMKVLKKSDVAEDPAKEGNLATIRKNNQDIVL